MMVDGGITEGVEEVGGEGGGLIIFSREEKRETRLASTRKTERRVQKLLYLTLPYLIVTKRYDSFRKKSLYCEEKEPKQPFLFH